MTGLIACAMFQWDWGSLSSIRPKCEWQQLNKHEVKPELQRENVIGMPFNCCE